MSPFPNFPPLSWTTRFQSPSTTSALFTRHSSLVNHIKCSVFSSCLPDAHMPSLVAGLLCPLQTTPTIFSTGCIQLLNCSAIPDAGQLPIYSLLSCTFSHILTSACSTRIQGSPPIPSSLVLHHLPSPGDQYK